MCGESALCSAIGSSNNAGEQNVKKSDEMNEQYSGRPRGSGKMNDDILRFSNLTKSHDHTLETMSWRLRRRAKPDHNESILWFVVSKRW